MSEITITGHSDDCIEVDGDIGDEFNAYDEWRYLHFDDGSVVKIGYGMKDGPAGKGWHIEALKVGEGTTATHQPPEMDGGDHYTDVLTLVGDIGGVRCWSGPDGPTLDDMEDFFDDMSASDYPLEKLRAAFAALTSK